MPLRRTSKRKSRQSFVDRELANLIRPDDLDEQPFDPPSLPGPPPFNPGPVPFDFIVCAGCVRPFFNYPEAHDGGRNRLEHLSGVNGITVYMCSSCIEGAATIASMKGCGSRVKRIRIEIETPDGTIRADEWSKEKGGSWR